jgi:hypothetical protein
MNVKFEDVLNEVEYEKQSIDETLSRLYQVMRKYDSQNADLVFEPAIGTYLMNFYNGVENIIKRIGKAYYKIMPASSNWHKDLLLLSMEQPKGRHVIFKSSLVDQLMPYLKFRHRFVSGYGFQLEQAKMMELINNAKPLWKEIKKQLDVFFTKI